MNARVPDPLVVFLAHARLIAFNAPDHGSWALYERLKSMYRSQFPHHDHRQDAEIVRELAAIAGV